MNIKVNVFVFGIRPGTVVEPGNPLYDQLKLWAVNEDRMCGTVICTFVKGGTQERLGPTEVERKKDPIVAADPAEKVGSEKKTAKHRQANNKGK